MGLLRILLIVLLIYFGVKIIARLLMPFALKTLVKKVEKRFGGQFNQQTKAQQQHVKKGETVIDKMPNTNTSANKDVGEYIDFEEIE